MRRFIAVRLTSSLFHPVSDLDPRFSDRPDHTGGRRGGTSTGLSANAANRRGHERVLWARPTAARPVLEVAQQRFSRGPGDFISRREPGHQYDPGPSVCDRGANVARHDRLGRSRHPIGHTVCGAPELARGLWDPRGIDVQPVRPRVLAGDHADPAPVRSPRVDPAASVRRHMGGPKKQPDHDDPSRDFHRYGGVRKYSAYDQRRDARGAEAGLRQDRQSQGPARGGPWYIHTPSGTRSSRS